MNFWTSQKSSDKAFSITIIAMIIIPVIILFSTHETRDSTSSDFICPSEYKTPEDYVESLAKWIKEKINANPKITHDEIQKLRDTELEKNKCGPSPWSLEDGIGKNVLNADEIMEGIKYAESQEPSRIGESPSEKDIYSNPYIRHIRLALNGYLNGTNNGVEEYALNDFGEGDCGLNNFDKSYYKSKFIVFNANDGEYGGVQANIVFVNKPDTIFWAWVFRFDVDGEYVLRAFCENGPSDKNTTKFKDFISDLIKATEYSL